MNFKLVKSQKLVCPPKTTASYRSINFVGKVGLGNDKKVNVWFEYGNSKDNLNYKTRILTLYQEGNFCIKESKKIKPCTTYYYRAGAKNSAGINYGEIKTIKTLCSDKFFKNNKSKK